jgi:hypothetical protein
MLKLAKMRPMTEQRLVRMMMDVVALQVIPLTEVRAAYESIEVMRDVLSRILDKADGKI